MAAVYFSMERPRFITIRMVRGYVGSKRAFWMSSDEPFLTADIAIGSMYVPTA